MSRYMMQTEDGHLAYGYDNPLREHFVQMLGEDDEIIFWLGTKMTIKSVEGRGRIYTGQEMADILAKYNVPEEHIEAFRRGVKI